MVGTREMPAIAMVTDNVTVVPKLVQLGPDQVTGFRRMEPSVFLIPFVCFTLCITRTLNFCPVVYIIETPLSL